MSDGSTVYSNAVKTRGSRFANSLEEVRCLCAVCKEPILQTIAVQFALEDAQVHLKFEIHALMSEKLRRSQRLLTKRVEFCCDCYGNTSSNVVAVGLAAAAAAGAGASLSADRAAVFTSPTPHLLCVRRRRHRSGRHTTGSHQNKAGDLYRCLFCANACHINCVAPGAVFHDLALNCHAHKDGSFRISDRDRVLNTCEMQKKNTCGRQGLQGDRRRT